MFQYNCHTCLLSRDCQVSRETRDECGWRRTTPWPAALDNSQTKQVVHAPKVAVALVLLACGGEFRCAASRFYSVFLITMGGRWRIPYVLRFEDALWLPSRWCLFETHKYHALSSRASFLNTHSILVVCRDKLLKASDLWKGNRSAVWMSSTFIAREVGRWYPEWPKESISDHFTDWSCLAD